MRLYGPIWWLWGLFGPILRLSEPFWAYSVAFLAYLWDFGTYSDGWSPIYGDIRGGGGPFWEIQGLSSRVGGPFWGIQGLSSRVGGPFWGIQCPSRGSEAHLGGFGAYPQGRRPILEESEPIRWSRRPILAGFGVYLGVGGPFWGISGLSRGVKPILGSIQVVEGPFWGIQGLSRGARDTLWGPTGD